MTKPSKIEIQFFNSGAANSSFTANDLEDAATQVLNNHKSALPGVQMFAETSSGNELILPDNIVLILQNLLTHTITKEEIETLKKYIKENPIRMAPFTSSHLIQLDDLATNLDSLNKSFN